MIYFNPPGPAGPFLPTFFSEDDPRPAKEQAHEAYAHGGGWWPFEGFELVKVGEKYQLQYPEDPPVRELSRAKLRDETLVFFEFSWFAIIQPDGSFQVARMD